MLRRLAWVAVAALLGRLIGVLNGDTVDLLDLTQRTHRTRLAGIEAPEFAYLGMAAQPSGREAREALAEMLFAHGVSVELSDVDPYGRVIGAITCNGSEANLAMVQQDWARAHRQYLRVQRRTPYPAVEETARHERRGLWADANPIAPWDWRKEACHAK